MNGQKWALALVLILLCAGLGAMPEGREMESLKLIDALAVDGGEEITVTAVTGVRVSEDEEAEVLTGTRDSLTAACGDLRESSSRRTYLGQTKRLLVGEGQDLGQVLDLVVNHRELRLDTLLYIVRGAAGPALEASAEKTAGETGGRDPRGRTVGELLPRLAEGAYTLAPALEADEQGQLAPAGWAVLADGGIVGYLEENAAVGAELLLGKAGGQAVTLKNGGVELTDCRVWTGESGVRCTLTARLVQGTPTREELEDWGEEQLCAALAAGWDCWGLDREMAALRPWDWERLREKDIRALDVKVTGRLVGERGKDR